MFLNVVKGPQSYDEIKTVNDHKHNTFKSTSEVLGLGQINNEWNEALQEANSWTTKNMLREMFATLLMFYEIITL